MPGSPTSPSLAAGHPQRVGPYRIDALLGQGGMGEVFRAFDERLGRPVAIKRLHAHRTTTDRRRFRREARILAQLGHPAILQIFDLVDDAEGDWIVTEFIDGPTLADVLQDGALAVGDVIDLARQIASALGAAHARDIIHRDLKTENVMMLPSGYAKVLDFGLARRVDGGSADRSAAGDGGVDDDANISGEHRMAGTPRAMPPEQLTGQPLDARADLFSFGVLLYELLTAVSPFRSGHLGDTLQRVLNHVPPSVCALRAEVPRALSTLIDQMLAKEPAHRPTSAEVIAEAIRRIDLRPAPSVDNAATEDTSDGADAARAPHDGARRLGERRQITALSCDVVGFAADTGRLEAPDPEVLADVLPTLRTFVDGHVVRYSGTVDTDARHRVVAYFGYPLAHEDDAVRAVRAALDLVAHRDRVPALDALRLRVGVHTGAAVIAAAPSGAGPGELIAGRTLDGAASAMRLAARDHVVVSPSTRRLVMPSFALEPVIGEASAIAGWWVTSTASAQPDLASAVDDLPMIARDLELRLLHNRWQMARDGCGQAVLVTGEAGIGKSRLVRAFYSDLRDQPRRWWTIHGSPFLQNSPLAPIVGGFRKEVLGHADTDPAIGDPAVDRARLRAFLAPYGPPVDATLPLLAALFGVPPDGAHDDAPPPSPDRQRKRTLDALTALMLRMAKAQPWVLLIEDLHWVDPSTFELLDRLVQRAASTSLLLLTTSRPHADATWQHGSGLTRVQIDNLTDTESERLIDRVADGRPLPAPLRRQILARADGVPLFVEELTQAILEVDVESDTFVIPSTLRDSLTARLDRLGSAKTVAQIASVIGRHFTSDLLHAIAGDGDDNAHATARRSADLDRLVQAGLLRRKGFGPSQHYRFKHALVQDIAYDALLRKDRERLHRRIATRLAAQAGTPGVDARPEILAHHLTAAGQPAEAVDLWARAGREALARSAYRESVQHLRTALCELDKLPETAARNRQELEILSALRGALSMITGFVSSDQEQMLARMLQLIAHVDDVSQQLVSMQGIWALHLFSGRLTQAHALAEHMVALVSAPGAKPDDDARRAVEASAMRGVLVGSALTMLGVTRRHLGRFDDAITLSTQATEHYPLSAPAVSMSGSDDLHHDARIVTLADRGDVLGLLGRRAASRAAIATCLALAARLDTVANHSAARFFALLVQVHERAARAVHADARALLDYCETHDVFLLEHTRLLLGWSEVYAPSETAGAHPFGAAVDPDAESTARGLARMADALARVRDSLRQMHDFTRRAAYLIEARIDASRLVDARTLCDEAYAHMATSEERYLESELARLAARLCLAGAPPAASTDRATDAPRDAHGWFAHAFAVAARQGAHALSLRTALDVDRFAPQLGGVDDARDRLRAAYARFAPADRTPENADLRDARRRLEAGATR
ncbi:MAG: protein kinase [Acidobacteriota bacterium]